MGRLSARLRRRAEIGAAGQAALYAIYERYYGGASEAVFRADLAAKDHVLELLDGDAVCGFSTIALVPFEAGGRANLAIFSGDTVIRHEYWGEQVLARAFCRHAGTVRAAHPGTPLWWLLISKGHRTYRYLHAFAREYFPNARGPTPPAMQARIDAVASRRFGADYLSDRGIVRWSGARVFVRPEWVGVREGLDAHPEARFFHERNPGWAQGDELVCMASLELANLRSVAARAFAEGLDDADAVAAL